jgi:CheY-like chemotaxis protein
MNKRFLLIDDDSDDRELFSEALIAVDPVSVCDRVPDGEQAFSKLESRQIDKPDMIFLDINLPTMSGWQILSKLKDIDDYRQIPVIIYSTSTNPRDRDLAQNLGALCFFSKPNDYKKLKSMLEIVVVNMNSNSVSKICNAVHQMLKAS